MPTPRGDDRRTPLRPRPRRRSRRAGPAGPVRSPRGSAPRAGGSERSRADAAERVARLDLANPAAPDRLDRQLADWWELAGLLADAIRRAVPGEDELIIVPGRRLAATPLHAMGWPRRPLIADRPVTSTPNHRLLAAKRSAELPRAALDVGVVAVPKATDGDAFIATLEELAEDIGGLTATTRVESGRTADEASARGLIGSVEQLVVLCHGYHGGPTLGPGLCVAADGLLPPASLPLADDPSLGAFVLTWDDLVGLPRSPDTVVSIACSSGRTVVGSGGARLGLETGLLANSTRFLVAPLWNVEQRSAVRWVRAYTAASAASEDPPRAHRLATLQLMDRHPHPYHWAPYAMSTALRGAPS